MSKPIIEVKNLKRSFRSVKKTEGWKAALKLIINPEYVDHEALKGVTFEIEEGAFVGLIGANGAGKTTLLKILSGLIPPTSGEARVMGIDPFTRTMDFRKKISLVMGQKAQLWWDLPAADAFDLLRAIYQIPETIYRDRLSQLTELLDVKKLLHTQIRRLSLGERMKMELIGAILHWPKVIYLDEPTIGLDVLAAAKLREFLKTHNQREKATIILTSHNMDDIERLCSRVMIVKSGEIIYDGMPQGLTNKGEKQLKVHLEKVFTSEELSQVTGLTETQIEVGAKPNEDSDDEKSEAGDPHFVTFNLTQEKVIPTLQSLMDRTSVIDIAIEGQSLEKVIQRLYEQQ